MDSFPHILCSFQQALDKGHSNDITPPESFHLESIWTQLFQAVHDIAARENPENPGLKNRRFGELSFKEKTPDELPLRMEALAFIIYEYTHAYLLSFIPPPSKEEGEELLAELRVFNPSLARWLTHLYFSPPLEDPEVTWEDPV